MNEMSRLPAFCLSAIVLVPVFAGVNNVKLDVGPDRVKTPLCVDLPRIGTIRPRAAGEIRGSNWRLGCETLDRDYINFEDYREFVAPLGIEAVRPDGTTETLHSSLIYLTDENGALLPSGDYGTILPPNAVLFHVVDRTWPQGTSFMLTLYDRDGMQLQSGEYAHLKE